MTATHVDTLTIQDHLRNRRPAIAAQLCEDAALAEFDLPPGTSLPVDLEAFTYAVTKIDKTAVNYFLGRRSHRAPVVPLATVAPKRRRWFGRTA